MTDHTSLHGQRSDDGRAPQIEEYVKKSVEYALNEMGMLHDSVLMLDLGCDYGFAMHHAKQLNPAVQPIGVDLYYTINPFDLDIRRESLEDPRLVEKLDCGLPGLIFVNHTLEHLYNPYILMSSIHRLSSRDSRIFIAVPHGLDDWSRAEGHYTIWTPAWLEHFCKLCGWSAASIVIQEFRPGHREIWGIFE
jgi:SAM-dependent methyltransferase